MLPLLCTLVFAASSQPNIIFLTVDTLRADRMGYNETSLTPNLDKIAESGIIFNDLICEEPQTGPSFCSFFSGRIPRTTGVIRNSVPLAPDIPVITEAFHNAGYSTAAVVSNWNLKGKLSGLDRAFNHYDEDFGHSFWGRTNKERRAEDTTSKAITWLEERPKDKPFFFWIHYMDPHGPYRYHGRFISDRSPIREMPLREQIRLRYDSEVAYTDYQIGRLLNALPDENTFIVFVADHGESLLEHDYIGHTRALYRNVVNVPLFINGPGITTAESDFPARGIDLAPTLLGLAGLEAAPGMMGYNLLNLPGISSRSRVIETYGGSIPTTKAGIEALANRPPQLQAVRDGEWKLILGEGGTRLYNIQHDPEERNNLEDEYPEKVEQLRKMIEVWDENTPRQAAQPATLSEEDRRALETLGYL